MYAKKVRWKGVGIVFFWGGDRTLFPFFWCNSFFPFFRGITIPSLPYLPPVPRANAQATHIPRLRPLRSLIWGY